MKFIIDDIKKLWKDTFGDSDTYIDMVVDHYYNAGYSRQYYDNEKLVSSSLVIPYKFYISGIVGSEKSNIVENINIGDVRLSNNFIVGEYLSGLMTIPEMRGRGLMRKMISEIERAAYERGSAFTFLIPADNNLRDYYTKLGYENTASLGFINIGLSGIANSSSLIELENMRDDLDKKLFKKGYVIKCIKTYEEFLRLLEKININKSQFINLDSDIFILHSKSEWQDIFADIY
ncbi:MAG: GNAT family N-acetyltransferase, partial [Muribaculaceae bacterium]|nr:GNAT family N-acetyltransferase [Muribaculaceae bacterium]